MAYNNQAGPFWDFVRSMNTQNQNPTQNPNQSTAQDDGAVPPPSYGPGYQHAGPNPPPFGPFGPGMGMFGFPAMNTYGPPDYGHGFGHDHHGFGGWGGRGRGRHCGPGGRHGRHGSRSRSPSHNDEKAREAPEEGETSMPEGSGTDGPSHRRCGGRRGGRHHGPGGRHAHGFPGAPFDLSALLGAFASHPIAQAFQQFANQARAATEDDNTFTPAIDVFDTPTAYVLHVALPGAKKEDVGVNWDAEKSELNVAGVIYRGGDEEFLKNLSQAERKVGVFERSVKLGGGDASEVDGDAIVAKLEDGVLVVTVPKVEKEWTEVKKVDIL